jgi:hypothetical protein
MAGYHQPDAKARIGWSIHGRTGAYCILISVFMLVFSRWCLGQMAPNLHPIQDRTVSGVERVVSPVETDDIYLETMPSWHSNDQDDRQKLAVGDLNGDGYPEVYSACRVSTGSEGRDRAYVNSEGQLLQDPWWTQDPAISCYSAALSDADTNGYLDVAIADSSGGAIHLNNGGVLRREVSWRGTDHGITKDVAWAWVRQDPCPELICASDNSTGQNIPSALHDNTAGALSIPVWTNQAYRDRCCAWGDIDNDGDPDLCLGNFEGQNHIYRNTDQHLETWAHWTSFLSDGTLSVAFADINADGWLDLVEGNYNSPNRVYFNLGDGEFETSPSWSSTVVTNTWQLGLGDVDNDGDIDLVCGARNTGDVDKVFENTGFGLNPVPVWSSALATNTVGLALADFDLDGDLDLVTASAGSYIYRYENLIQTANTAPDPPTVLNSEVHDSSVTLTWNDGDDLETPAVLLTYNLRVGTAPGLADVVHAPAGMQNSCPSFGNHWHAQTKTLDDLDVGIYYWSVQTVDAGFVRSGWAAEQSFEITPSSADWLIGVNPLTYSLAGVYPNPFNPEAVVEFTVPHRFSVRLTVVNTLGQTVAVLADRVFDSGTHRVMWDGRNVLGRPAASGLYLFVLTSDKGSCTEKAILLR